MTQKFYWKTCISRKGRKAKLIHCHLVFVIKSLWMKWMRSLLSTDLQSHEFTLNLSSFISFLFFFYNSACRYAKNWKISSVATLWVNLMQGTTNSTSAFRFHSIKSFLPNNETTAFFHWEKVSIASRKQVQCKQNVIDDVENSRLLV